MIKSLRKSYWPRVFHIHISKSPLKYYGAYLVRVLDVLLHQMLTKCKTLPYESLAWASKSNITGRNCFRMQLSILNVLFYSIQFSFNTQNIFTNITVIKCIRYIDQPYIGTCTYARKCRCWNNLHQINKIKQQKTKYHTTDQVAISFLFFVAGHQLSLSPPPIIHLSLDLLQSICNSAHRSYSQ